MRTIDLHAGAPAGLLIRRLSWCLVFVLALVILPEFTRDPGLRSIIPALLTLLFLQLTPVVMARQPDLFEPVVYTGIMGAVATTAQLAYFYQLGQVEIPLIRGLTPDQAAELASTTLWASLVGVVSYYAGYYHPTWGRRWSRVWPKVGGIQWDRSRLLIVSVVLWVLWAVSYAYFQVRLNVPLFNFRELGAGKAIWREDATLSWMVRGALLAAIPIYLYFADALNERNNRRTLYWGAALGIVGLLVLRIGQRGNLFHMMLGGLVLVHYLRRRIPVWIFTVALFVAVALNTVMLEWRTGYDTGAPETFVDATGKPVTTLAAHEDDRERFAALAVVIHAFPEHHDYLLGESWLGLLAQPIPRWIWPSKSRHFEWRDTQIVKNLAGAPVPSSYLGTLFANFGWLGIVLGMLLWGIVQRALYEWLVPRQGDRNVVLLYSTLLLYFGFTLLQFSSVMQYTIPIYFILKWIRTQGAASGHHRVSSGAV